MIHFHGFHSYLNFRYKNSFIILIYNQTLLIVEKSVFNSKGQICTYFLLTNIPTIVNFKKLRKFNKHIFATVSTLVTVYMIKKTNIYHCLLVLIIIYHCYYLSVSIITGTSFQVRS